MNQQGSELGEEDPRAENHGLKMVIKHVPQKWFKKRPVLAPLGLPPAALPAPSTCMTLKYYSGLQPLHKHGWVRCKE